MKYSICTAKSMNVCDEFSQVNIPRCLVLRRTNRTPAPPETPCNDYPHFSLKVSTALTTNKIDHFCHFYTLASYRIRFFCVWLRWPILIHVWMSKNSHHARPHPSWDGREQATQILGGVTIHSKQQDKKFLVLALWALLGNWWCPLRAVMVEGQHLPSAIPLIFQGEWRLELLNIPRRAINLILATFNCRMKWPVFLAIFIFSSQSLVLWFSGSQAHGFLPSFRSWMLSPFGCYISAEFSPPPDPGAFSYCWTEEIQEL